MTPPIRAAWFALAAALVAGCGGGGETGRAAPAAQGQERASLKIKWPPRSRLIPEAAKSIVVTLTKDVVEVVKQTLNRPDDGDESTLLFTGLPSGTLAVRAEAFPDYNGAGVAQAAGYGVLSIASGGDNTVTVAMDSTVKTLALAPFHGSPSPDVCAVGDSFVVIATGKDADGNMVLIGNRSKVDWLLDDPEQGSLEDVYDLDFYNPPKALRPLKAGSNVIRVRLKVKDDGSYVEASYPVRTVERTLALGGDASAVFGSSVSSWKFPATTPPSYRITGTIDPPTAVNGLEFPLTTEGPISTNSMLFFGFYHSDASAGINIKHVDAETAATLGGLTKSFTTIVKPNPVADLACPTSVVGGTEATGTVSLGLYAYTGENVSLACSDPDVSLPTTVTVPEPTLTKTGFLSGIYHAVKSVDFRFTPPKVSAPRTVIITASRPGSSKQFEVRIDP